MGRQTTTWQGLQEILASASETDCMEGVSEERNQEPMAQKWDSPHTRAHKCVYVGAGSLLACGLVASALIHPTGFILRAR